MEIARAMEDLAPLSFQESYDNAGIQVGNLEMEVTGILVALDVTETVLEEAAGQGLNLILSHHPVLFKPLKSLTGRSLPERVVAGAIRKGIAIYSAHTNFDAITGGVNRAMAERLGLKNLRVLDPMQQRLKKLVVFVPHAHLEQVREAMFGAGAGRIGDYDSCSFNLEGQGSFRGSNDTQPFVGEPGVFHQEPETRVETIVPSHLVKKVVTAMVAAHPYQEVAYDIYPLENDYPLAGMGMVGDLEDLMEEKAFMDFVRERFGAAVVRHSALLGKPIGRVAVCGGSGGFLTGKALASGAGVLVTGELRYHQFYEAEGRIVLMDIGHFESEQFTRQLFCDLLMKKFPKFAIRLSETDTNPINYY
jgi:dinuclear metal center YbgI/SA1388 family protein